ncbi:MAG: serine hydrolase domain-containing protein [Myxococcota bacterium]|nr:serine hydrolase domain-containing protein [Myxococcota bacterium]
MGITREGSATIRAIVFVFGLACLGACSAADKPSSEDDRGAGCMLDSECAMGERCDASECVPVDDVPDAEPATEADLIEVLEESTIADLAVILGNRDGIQFTYSKGDLDIESIIPIASASKWLSAMILMRLVEEGVLSLSDNPQDYLSFWTESADDPRSRITLAHLLSFTSGFEGSTGLGAQEGVNCVEDAETTIEACAEAIFASGLKEDGGYFAYEPGTTFYYGPIHLHIAAAMAVSATGLRWNQLFRQYVGAGLGLAVQTGFGLPSLENARASGGGTASASDYATILQSYINGTILTAESVSQMSQDRTPIDSVTMESVPAVASDGVAWHYAFGSWRECNQPIYDESCEGDGVISSPGAFGFYPWWDRRDDSWGVIATQLPLAGSRQTVPLGHTLQALIKDVAFRAP